MNRWTDRRTNKQMITQTNEQTNEKMERRKLYIPPDILHMLGL